MRSPSASSVLVALFLLALPACGDDGSVPVDPADATGTSAGTVCTRTTVAGCTMVGIRLEPPLPLTDALALGFDLGGTPIAVYRTDSACVPEAQFSPVDEPASIASRFAYVDADAIARRRMDAVDGGRAPPISGLHISQSYWNQWSTEWSEAQSAGVRIEGVAVWISEAIATALHDDPGVAGAVPLQWRWTDSIDPSYPGELLMDGRSFPGLGSASDPGC